MPDITGPVGMTLLEKNGVRYLMIADQHDAYNIDGCESPDAIMIQTYLDSAFFKGEQWDFYFEQGAYGIEKGDEDEEHAKFLYEAKKKVTSQEIAKHGRDYRQSLKDEDDMLKITYNYYRKNGCFYTERTRCNLSYDNVRFHFIDTRQANFGVKCKLPAYTHYKNIGVAAKTLYQGLFQVIDSQTWDSEEELREALTYYCATYFHNVENVLNCLNEPKLLGQLDKSTMKSELQKYFSPPLRILNIILSTLLVKLKPQIDEIVNTIIILLDHFSEKENAREEMSRIIFEELPAQFGKRLFGVELWDRMNEMIQNSSYFRYANSLPLSDVRLKLIPTQMVFEGEKLIMDMYALARMTKPYNKNVVLMTGHNHYNNYIHFLEFVGAKVIWNGEQLSEKCVRVPEWQPRKPKRFLGLFGGAKTQKRIPLCCNATHKDKTCRRGSDGKVFSLPRKFTRRNCFSKNRFGFSERASCAPYLGGQRREKKTRKKGQNTSKPQFLYHPNNPDKSFDVYIDKNPKDTIPIKFTTVDDVKHTIRKLERLYKSGKYSHKRIWQVGMIMKVRLDAIKKHHPRVAQIKERTQLARAYFKFLGKRTKRERLERRKMKFEIPL
tara:strand:+ start:1952 stop:3772 length:1821 start_codon:yes stop_codon:yes gene_type:complete